MMMVVVVAVVMKSSQYLADEIITESNAQYTPPTPTRRNCFVASASAV